MHRIRRGVPADAAPLARFLARLFAETFGHSTTPANLEHHLATRYGETQQGRELADPTCITWVVDLDGVAAGVAQVRASAPPLGIDAPGLVELQRFYLDTTLHGSGAASALMSACQSACEELGGSGLWLSVWEENPRAIAFYRKAGFRDAGATDFWLGDDRQCDRVMVRESPREN